MKSLDPVNSIRLKNVPQLKKKTYLWTFHSSLTQRNVVQYLVDSLWLFAQTDLPFRPSVPKISFKLQNIKSTVFVKYTCTVHTVLQLNEEEHKN